METLIEQKRTGFARMLDLPGEEPTVSLTLVTNELGPRQAWDFEKHSGGS